MNKEDFIRIAEKVSDGSANKEELKQYNHYFNQYQQAYPVWNELSSAEKENIGEALGKRISTSIEPVALTQKWQLWPRYVAAAAMLLMLSFGIYFYRNEKVAPPYVVHQKNQDLHPGSNKAFLTLADGRKIDLDEAHNTNLAEQSGISIIKAVDGQLIYKTNANATATGSNTIETPVGGQYQVRLPDGTEVWLNSSSSLRYPIRFTGGKRVVEVRGEAYFEVAHQAKMPFVVRSIKQEIEVLGTHFNVMAYADEAEVQTTLLQGSVKISTAENSLLLKPGQQAQVTNVSALLNPNADIEDAVAWKTGKIQFTNMNIQNIMRTLARWYDFDAEYQGKQTNTTFGGSFSRTKNLSVILKSLESTGDIHFKIEGRRVIVMP